MDNRLLDSLQVLLFDEVGSTYMCMIGERSEHIEEFYRLDNQGPWQLVNRSDTARSEFSFGQIVCTPPSLHMRAADVAPAPPGCNVAAVRPDERLVHVQRE
jgi:hypothetical protein